MAIKSKTKNVKTKTKKSKSTKKPKEFKVEIETPVATSGYMNTINGNVANWNGNINGTSITTTTNPYINPATGIYNQPYTNIGTGTTGIGIGSSISTPGSISIGQGAASWASMSSQIRINEIILLDEDGDEWSIKITKDGKLKLNPMNKSKKTKLKLDIILSEK